MKTVRARYAAWFAVIAAFTPVAAAPPEPQPNLYAQATAGSTCAAAARSREGRMLSRSLRTVLEFTARPGAYAAPHPELSTVEPLTKFGGLAGNRPPGVI